MALRDTLNKAPAFVVGFVVLAVAIAIWIGMSQFRTEKPNLPTGAYYTVDDGKTWFVGSADEIPPISHEGKEAVRLVMFECAGKQTPGYLERYTPEAKAFLEKGKNAPANAPPPDMGQAMGIVMNGKEVKQIGGTTWVKENNRAVSIKIMQVKCEDGQPAKLLPVNK